MPRSPIYEHAESLILHPNPSGSLTTHYITSYTSSLPSPTESNNTNSKTNAPLPTNLKTLLQSFPDLLTLDLEITQGVYMSLVHGPLPNIRNGGSGGKSVHTHLESPRNGISLTASFRNCPVTNNSNELRCAQEFTRLSLHLSSLTCSEIPSSFQTALGEGGSWHGDVDPFTTLLSLFEEENDETISTKKSGLQAFHLPFSPVNQASSTPRIYHSSSPSSSLCVETILPFLKFATPCAESIELSSREKGLGFEGGGGGRGCGLVLGVVDFGIPDSSSSSSSSSSSDDNKNTNKKRQDSFFASPFVRLSFSLTTHTSKSHSQPQSQSQLDSFKSSITRLSRNEVFEYNRTTEEYRYDFERSIGLIDSNNRINGNGNTNNGNNRRSGSNPMNTLKPCPFANGGSRVYTVIPQWALSRSRSSKSNNSSSVDVDVDVDSASVTSIFPDGFKPSSFIRREKGDVVSMLGWEYRHRERVERGSGDWWGGVAVHDFSGDFVDNVDNGDNGENGMDNGDSENQAWLSLNNAPPTSLTLKNTLSTIQSTPPPNPSQTQPQTQPQPLLNSPFVTLSKKTFQINSSSGSYTSKISIANYHPFCPVHFKVMEEFTWQGEIEWYLSSVQMFTRNSGQEEKEKERDIVIVIGMDELNPVVILPPSIYSSSSSSPSSHDNDNDENSRRKSSQYILLQPPSSSNETLPPNSSLLITFVVTPKFVKSDDFETFANRGFYSGGVSGLFEFVDGCFGDINTSGSGNNEYYNESERYPHLSSFLLPSNNNTRYQSFHSTPTTSMIYQPVPDMTMVFNVVTLTCTVLAWVLGTVVNLAGRKRGVEEWEKYHEEVKRREEVRVKEVKERVKEVEKVEDCDVDDEDEDVDEDDEDDDEDGVIVE